MTATATKSQLFELVAPSDPYTFRAPNLAAAVVANLFLTEWKGALNALEGDEVKAPFYPFGCRESAMDAEILKHTGATLQDYLAGHRNEVAEVLESVLIGSRHDRAIFESATAKMAPAEAAIFRAEWHDKKQSSMNDIGKRAQQLAAHFRSET